MSRFFEIDDVIVKLYAKYGETFFDSEEVLTYYDSLEPMAQAKFLFLVAYELQEMEQGLPVLFKFNEFVTNIKSLEEDGDIKLFNGLISMSKCLARQCVIPKDFEHLMVRAQTEPDVKEFFEVVMFNLLECFKDLSECIEDDFGKNMILRCVYDYETDYIYNILRSYLSNFNGKTKVPLDHTIAFADYDERLVPLFVNVLVNYYNKAGKNMKTSENGLYINNELADGMIFS